jgi:hypothetical protein
VFTQNQKKKMTEQIHRFCEEFRHLRRINFDPYSTSRARLLFVCDFLCLRRNGNKPDLANRIHTYALRNPQRIEELFESSGRAMNADINLVSDEQEEVEDEEDEEDEMVVPPTPPQSIPPTPPRQPVELPEDVVKAVEAVKKLTVKQEATNTHLRKLKREYQDAISDIRICNVNTPNKIARLLDLSKEVLDLEKQSKEVFEQLSAIFLQDTTNCCGICYEEYDDTSRKRMALAPCGHTFCIRCAGSVQICPTCRKQIQNRIAVYL